MEPRRYTPMVIQGDGEPKPDENSPFVTHLDHDHREGENIRFLTKCPILSQDLRRSPPCSVAMTLRGASYTLQLLSGRSKAEIRDSRTTGDIHKGI